MPSSIVALALVTWYYLEIRIWFFTDAKANRYKKNQNKQRQKQQQQQKKSHNTEKKNTKQWIAILSAKTDSPVCF